MLQIKYTAYSGWISSGLVSWTIDKVAIIDSFGKVLSVCKKGLILESGRSVYLPLYPGECNIPLDIDNSTVSSAVLERVTIEDRQSGIGPFTKEQNYETKNPEYPAEILSTDRTSQRRSGLGPFTKEQNRRIVEVETATTFEDVEKPRNVANPWTVLDISGDGDSNSLENSELEQGRSFSGAANLIYHASTASESVAETTVTTVATTTEYLPEIREPVLRPSKKDAGRSLKLPEITEPILRPRATRHNTRNEMMSQQQQPHERQRDEIQETSSTSTRSFTVQFLPERLAGILAQAERYARQTLLPLISQYTPSFVTGIRHEEPKYFPLLSDIVRPRNADNTAENSRTSRQKNGDQILRVDIGQRKSEKALSVKDGHYEGSTSSTKMENDKNVEVSPMIVEAVYPEKVASANSTGLERKIASESSDWQPIGESATPLKNAPSRRDSNVSRSLDWSVDNSHDWTSQTVNANREVEIETSDDDWVPITVKSDAISTTAATLGRNGEETIIDIINSSRKFAEDGVLDEIKEEATSIANTYERKFIPLVDLEATTDSSSSSTDANIPRSTTIASHIQKIPRYKTTVKSARTIMNPTMMFPYAYERTSDRRTRYIPLIPEEDMGKSSYPMSERDR